MNKIILIGRLTQKPKLITAGNKMVALFTLAVNRDYVKKNEEVQTDFLNIIALGKLGEFAQKYLDKGTPIYILARLQNRKYKDKNDIQRTVTEIIAEEINFIDVNKENIEDLTLQEPQSVMPETSGINQFSNELAF